MVVQNLEGNVFFFNQIFLSFIKFCNQKLYMKLFIYHQYKHLLIILPSLETLILWHQDQLPFKLWNTRNWKYLEKAQSYWFVTAGQNYFVQVPAKKNEIMGYGRPRASTPSHLPPPKQKQFTQVSDSLKSFIFWFWKRWREFYNSI